VTLSQLRERIAPVNAWLLTAIFFFIPIQAAPAYLLSALLLVLWIVEGRLGPKLRALAAEPLVWIFLGYWGVLALSMLWTEDTDWGWRMVRRQNFFLLFLLYFSVARREHFDRYVAAFLASIALCEALAFYNWTQMHVWPALPEGIRVDKGTGETAPFVDRIMYTPILALAGYLAGHRLLFDARTMGQRLLYGGLLVATTLNLVIGGGRAGMVGFLALFALLVFQRFARRPVIATALATVLAGGIVLGAYHSNDHFKGRVDAAFDEIVNFRERPNTAPSLRIVYAINAWRIFSAQPLLGVGIGDYRAEYERVNAIHTPQWGAAWNPHNQYLYVLTAAGLAGGVALALVLGVPLLRRGPADGRERIRRAPPLLLIVICLSESYLLRSNVSLMYVLFLAALWCGVPRPSTASAYLGRSHSGHPA